MEDARSPEGAGAQAVAITFPSCDVLSEVISQTQRQAAHAASHPPRTAPRAPPPAPLDAVAPMPVTQRKTFTSK